MELRPLGDNGPKLSRIGLGCMGMSDFPPRPGSRGGARDAESIATIEAALDAGVNFINTGDFYGMGHNETLVARALAGRRDQAFLSVKCGVQRSPAGAFLGLDVRPASIKNFCAYSLQRLDVEVIDLYQPGRLIPSVPLEETVGAVVDLIKEGNVRHLGLTEVTGDQLRRAHAIHPVAAVEVEYSLAARHIEQDVIPVARELGVSVVAYSVVAEGLLTGAIKGPLAPGDPRNFMPRFQGAALAKNLEKVAELERLAAAKGLTPSQLAVAWVLSRGDDIVALVGMSRRARLPENLAALDVALTAADVSALDRLFAPGAIVGDRYPPQVSRQWRPREGGGAFEGFGAVE